MKPLSIPPIHAWPLPVLSSALALVLALSACGGGDSADASNPSSAAVSNTALPTRFAVYAYGQGMPTNDAGAVDAGRLELGGGLRTQLTLIGSDGGISASNLNFRVVSRRDGAVLMLCDPAGFSGGADPTRYVAIGTQGGAGAAVEVTSESELIGLRFNPVRGCSLVDNSGATQGRSENPDAQTRTYTVQADGSLRVSNGSALSAGQFRALVSGGPINLGEGVDRLTFYRFTLQGQTRYFAVSRFVPTASRAGAAELNLWLPQ